MTLNPDLDLLEKKATQHAKFGAHCVATLPELMKLIEEIRKSRELVKAADQMAEQAQSYVDIGFATGTEDVLVINSINYYRSLRDK